MIESPLYRRLEEGMLDDRLYRLYGGDRMSIARERYRMVYRGFCDTFQRAPESFYSAPGRTELGGNHTDHQHGCVLAASVDRDILAAVATNKEGKVRLLSEPYSYMVVDLASLDPKPEEKNTTAALIRGVASCFARLGCRFDRAGLDAYIISDVPGGGGLSSSAAFEILLGNIFNDLFYDNRCTPIELAQIGQYAENVYFGKPCGLMDQTACSVGGVVAIDFADPARPVVEPLELDLCNVGYALCMLNSLAGHEDLTEEYASITRELRDVSGYFGRDVLRDVPEGQFMAAIHPLREQCGDRAVLRALHFYEENERARQQAEALRMGNFDRFLALVRRSGISSALYLQNIVPTGRTREQALMVAIAFCSHILGDRGAVRVHGGGFGGFAQAFVPLEMLSSFREQTEDVLGPRTCDVLSVRPAGGVKLS